MAPWEIAERLVTQDQESILSQLKKDDPFWVASYAIDPFVGIIYRLPLSNPARYGSGVNHVVFDKLVRYILDGKLTGDDLAMAVEQFSRTCTEAEWLLWYRPILHGEIDLQIPLDLFNEYCPDEFRLSLPSLSKPKAVGALSDLPKKFVVQPAYPYEPTFWFINSQYLPIDVRGYDQKIRRFRNSVIEDMLFDFAKKSSVDMVLFGYAAPKQLLIEDLVTRDQFTRESSSYVLHQRLAVLAKLGLPMVQISEILTPEQPNELYRELNLVFEQRYEGAIIRDIDAHYAFRQQPDRLIKPSVKGVVEISQIIPEVGLSGKYIRGSKRIETIVRLGLTNSILRDISEPQTGKKLDVLSCGVRGGDVMFPVFKGWRNQ